MSYNPTNAIHLRSMENREALQLEEKKDLALVFGVTCVFTREHKKKMENIPLSDDFKKLLDDLKTKYGGRLYLASSMPCASIISVMTALQLDSYFLGNVVTGAKAAGKGAGKDICQHKSKEDLFIDFEKIYYIGDDTKFSHHPFISGSSLTNEQCELSPGGIADIRTKLLD